MKPIFLFLLFCGLPFLSFACDICGCGIGNNYIGILPDFQKHIIGIRYRHNSMLTHLGAGGNSTHLTTRELYHTTERWSGWNITRKIRIMASVPYSIISKSNQGQTAQKNGLGDISLTGLYELLNKRTTTRQSRLLVQSLWLGGGVKLATGSYNPADKSTGSQNLNLFQLGTGSYDFNITAMYDLRLQDAGINLNSNYKINTVNRHAYQYGNKLTLNSQVYYKFRTKHKIMIAPNAGAQFETAETDLDNHLPVFASGGNLLLGTLGMEIVFNRFSVGANYQQPLSQQLANHVAKARNRFMIHMAMTL